MATVVDPPTPEVVFSRIAHLPHALWLDSSSDAAGTGAWSFVAVDPFAILQGRAGRATWISPDGVERLAEAPLTALARRLRAYRVEPGPLPFGGGAAGFIGYETAGEIERVPAPRARDHGLPDLHLAFYDVVIGWNHRTGTCHVVSTGHPERASAAVSRSKERLSSTLAWLAGAGPAPRDTLGPVTDENDLVAGSSRVVQAAPPARSVVGHPGFESTMTEAEYREVVAGVITAIEEGEVYQVNLSQRFAAPVSTTAEALYRKLRRRSPAPFGACVNVGAAAVLSTSPERFLRVRPDGFVETRPIKGTRPRGEAPETDARLADELRTSEKDRAENLMIVDLMRNDLSRICAAGTLRVPELFRLESWATVHHLVSVVQGRLREGVEVDELLAATFPCGSVTGAPKIRAMEMIASLERVARGPYCGAIGYFGFGGDVDLSVAIRILVHEAGRAIFHAGGGVVADSDPAAEYRETVDKARAILEALAGETTSR